MTDDDPPPPQGDPRVYFAAERTLLAWIRTGLALMGFGFVVARFGLFLRELAAARATAPAPQHFPGGLSLWAGTALVLAGVAVNVLAALQHASFVRRFRRNQPLELGRRPPIALTLAALLAAIGLAMALYLVLVR